MNVTKEMLSDLIYSSINESLRKGERIYDYSHGKIAVIVDELFFVAGQELKKHHPIEIRNFGTFSIVDTKAKRGRNFKTGEAIIIPAAKKIKFTASSALYEAPARKISCENEITCPLRISTVIKKNGCPIRICRYHYRCPSRTPDLFQNDPVFAKNATVLNVTTGELVRARQDNVDKVPELNVPIVIIYCETKFYSQKVRLPQYFVLTFEKGSINPSFNSGPATVSFNNQTNKCYVRNSHLDYEFDINKPVLKNDEVLKILLNAKF